ncbi:MAG: 16S rRNA (cytosine(1402)-N(4))-methyltransferase RsmH [Ruminococcaceae bacterium]|nr:16S rRNA (cytosine(1402)-N(4))-methyltransferase RsmH [Oscillospiraceae bacterium]
MGEFSHVSVLLHETVDSLNVHPGGIYVDGTLGGGGHSAYLLEKMGTKGTLIGIDQDSQAILAAKKRISEDYDVYYINRNFSDIKEILKECQFDGIDGAMLDLGVSSHQLDEAERGFSYRFDAPLDMRMNREAALSAYDVVNTYSEEELANVIFTYGEERFARKIARLIVKQREKKPIETTFELTDVIRSAMGNFSADKHPAKRTFQAIRIEVNRELEVLEQALTDFFDCLKPGGRLAVITFHSLEDRMVKQSFREKCTGCTCPREFPVCVCGKQPRGKMILKKALQASPEELARNPRAKSAKLRVIEKR